MPASTPLTLRDPILTHGGGTEGGPPADTGCAPRSVTDSGPQSSPETPVPLHGPEPVARARTVLLLATAWPLRRLVQLPQSRGQRRMLLRETGNNPAIKSSDHGEKTTCALTSARLPGFSWPLTRPIRWLEGQSCSPGAASRPEGTWAQGRSGLTQPWSQPAWPETGQREAPWPRREGSRATGAHGPEEARCQPRRQQGGSTGWPRRGPGAPHPQLRARREEPGPGPLQGPPVLLRDSS